MTLACAGIPVGAAQAIAIGRAHILRQDRTDVEARHIEPEAVEDECARLHAAIGQARRQLRRVRQQIPAATAPDISAFIDTHLLMLDDPAIVEAPVELIRQRRWSAEWALQTQRDTLIRLFDEIDDPYLRTRKDDVAHVVDQIQQLLGGDTAMPPDTNSEVLNGKVIIAHDLSPAQTLLMKHHGIAAFVTESGGPMSHTAILARSLGIPAVVGVHHATRLLRQTEWLIVDGKRGMVLADTDAVLRRGYRRRIAGQRLHRTRLRALRDLPAVTRDGEAVTLMANIELPEDIDAARNNGAEAIGLYRTEFLYMNRDTPPDEEQHLDTYRRLVEGLDGIPITIRTLDLGADKPQHRLTLPDARSCNPALGLRAIRLCLKEPHLFRPQLRAILRASAAGPVRILLPMITTLAEVIEVRSLIEDLKTELRQEGLRFDPGIAVGGMIEVPAAAVCADLLARNLDFLSLGTNDLVQYTLAIDRADDEVNDLFDPLHPAVLRLIKTTIDAARASRTPVALCGEMAGDPRYVRLLLGMGLREFSMQPDSLLEVKRIVRSSNAAWLEARVGLMLERPEEDPAPLLDEINR